MSFIIAIAALGLTVVFTLGSLLLLAIVILAPAAFVDLFRRSSKGAKAEPSGGVAESPKAAPLTLS
ncbi:MAG: hypothetical protein JOZ29_01035 [Deltaproteobacteria bacterium]|nr:hypothetical protein [Deltaproteobacteria bacterium]